MKKLITLLLVLLSVSSYSQKKLKQSDVVYYNYKAVPIYSDWFRFEYYETNGKLSVMTLPKHHKSFSLNSESVESRIVESQVRNLMLPSLNEYRDNYSLSHALENKILTIISNEYSKSIKSIFTAKHSNLKENELHKKNNENTLYLSEGICFISYKQLTKIPDSVNINKVICDFIFDKLTSCPAHAQNLQKEYNIFEIGFGLDFRKNGIMVVLQYRDKKGDI